MSKKKKAVKKGNISASVVKTSAKPKREVVEFIPEAESSQLKQTRETTSQDSQNNSQQSMHPHHKKVYVWVGIGLLLVILFVIFLNMNKTGDVAGKAIETSVTCNKDTDCDDDQICFKKISTDFTIPPIGMKGVCKSMSDFVYSKKKTGDNKLLPTSKDLFVGDTVVFSPVLSMVYKKVNHKWYLDNVLQTKQNYPSLYSIELIFEKAGTYKITHKIDDKFLGIQETTRNIVINDKKNINLANDKDSKSQLDIAATSEPKIGSGVSAGQTKEIAKLPSVGTNVLPSAGTTVTCTDKIKNQDETDVDCGGSCPTKCAVGKLCSINSDCTLLGTYCLLSDLNPEGFLGSCVSGCDEQKDCASTEVCDTTKNQCVVTQPSVGTTVTCTNKIKNQDEADVDCGGICPTKCAVGKLCSINSDCTTVFCDSGKKCAEKCTDTDTITKNDDGTALSFTKYVNYAVVGTVTGNNNNIQQLETKTDTCTDDNTKLIEYFCNVKGNYLDSKQIQALNGKACKDGLFVKADGTEGAYCNDNKFNCNNGFNCKDAVCVKKELTLAETNLQDCENKKDQFIDGTKKCVKKVGKWTIQQKYYNGNVLQNGSCVQLVKEIEKCSGECKDGMCVVTQPSVDQFTLACKDTDPLQNPYLEGAVLIGSNLKKDNCNIDKATNTDKLTQYFCNVQNSGIILGTETIVCKFGCNKTEGRCLTEKPKSAECKQKPALQKPYCGGQAANKTILYKPYYSTEKDESGNCKIENEQQTCEFGCKNGICVTTDSCQNGKQDSDTNEADVDCGGSCSVKCKVGKQCNANSDCDSGTCDKNKKICVIPPATTSDKQIEDCSSDMIIAVCKPGLEATECINSEKNYVCENPNNCGGKYTAKATCDNEIIQEGYVGPSGGWGGSGGSIKIKEEYKDKSCVNEGDTGKDPYTMGTTYKFGKPYADICEKTEETDKKSYLQEYSCNTDSLIKTVYLCVKGCNKDENACVN